MFLSTVSELTKVDELVVREGKRIVDGQGQRVALIISFILELRRLAEGFIVLFSLIIVIEVRRQMGPHMQRDRQAWEATE